jgi:hypothetical protein
MRLKLAPLSKAVRRVDRCLNHPGSLAGLLVLALAVASAWGYWYYETSVRQPAQLAELREESHRLRISLGGLQQSLEAADPDDTEILARQVRLGRETLLSPMDGVRAIDQIGALAQRTDITLSNVQMSPEGTRMVGDTQITVFNVGFTAQGDLDNLTDFTRALYEGVLPWLVVSEVQTSVSQQRPSLTARATLLTLPGQRPRLGAISVLLSSGQPAFEALHPEVSAQTAAEVPILAFTMESRLNGMDALRSVRIHTPQPELISTLKLYAEATGQEVTYPLGPVLAPISDRDECRPALSSACLQQQSNQKDIHIPTTATATPGGGLLLEPIVPFAFQGHREQRFYIIADLQVLQSIQTMVEITIPPEGVTFTSGRWPAAGFTQPITGHLVASRATDTPSPQGDRPAPKVEIVPHQLESEVSAVELTGDIQGFEDDTTISYQWDVTLDDSLVATGAESSFSFAPEKDGTYLVSLAVTDAEGVEVQDRVWIQVLGDPRHVEFHRGSESDLAAGKETPESGER